MLIRPPACPQLSATRTTSRPRWSTGSAGSSARLQRPSPPHLRHSPSSTYRLLAHPSSPSPLAQSTASSRPPLRPLQPRRRSPSRRRLLAPRPYRSPPRRHLRRPQRARVLRRLRRPGRPTRSTRSSRSRPLLPRRRSSRPFPSRLLALPLAPAARTHTAPAGRPRRAPLRRRPSAAGSRTSARRAQRRSGRAPTRASPRCSRVRYSGRRGPRSSGGGTRRRGGRRGSAGGRGTSARGGSAK